MDECISPRAMGYVRAFLSCPKLEAMSRTLPDGKVRIVVIPSLRYRLVQSSMMIEAVVHKVLYWMNKNITRHDEEHYLLTVSQFYKFMGVIYYSHNSGCSLKKVIHTLQRLGHDILSHSLSHYILTHLAAYAPTVRRHHIDSEGTWVAQRDHTSQLTKIKHITFNIVSRMFFVPLHKILTIGDDFVATSENDLQVKILSLRKARNEGHVADITADSLFNCMLGVIFSSYIQ